MQQEEFEFITENFDLIDEDEDIGKCTNTFIEILNDVLEKQSGQTESADRPNPPKKEKQATTPQSSKTLKPKREPKSKHESP